MSQLSLVLEFLVSAAIIWVAGVWLTRATDAIDTRYKLGSAFGGLLILGIATSLPEIAIVISASLAHHYDVIIGTLLGGVAIQTAAISLLDARMKVKSPITFSAASLTLVLEAVMVILVTVASILAIKTPLLIGSRVSLTSLFVSLVWLFGLWLIYQARQGLPWRAEPLQAHPGREHRERQAVINHPTLRDASQSRILIILGVSALAILISGVVLQSSGTQLASAWGIGAGLFAATFIALASALPDISTGITSVDLGDYKLAMSDIFGANAFMPALFFVCDLVAGRSVLSHATSTDIWFAALGILLSGIYVIGLILRPRKTFFHMGLDSLSILTIYIVGVVALSLSH
jgi:cation:H+ antiporter